MKCDRDFINRLHVPGGNHSFFTHIAEQRNLALHVTRQRPVATTQQDIRLDPYFAQFLDTVLGRFGLQFAGRRDVGDQRQVNIKDVFMATISAKLTDRLQKRQGFNVADRTADFDDRQIGAFGIFQNFALDLVGNVRDDLDRPPR